jgi:hypothetical protein
MTEISFAITSTARPRLGPTCSGPDVNEWIEDDGPMCGTCARRLGVGELATCRACVADARADLAAVLDAYGMLPALLNGLGSNAPNPAAVHGGSERPMPGGDVLVLLGPGSGADNQRRADAARRRAGRPGSDVWGLDDLPSDPSSVAYELGRWEDDWRRVRGEPAASGPAGVHTAADYLRDRLAWAAGHHDAFPDFAEDLARLRRRLEVATGTIDRPERADVPCLDCQGPLERWWTHAGLDDEWTCRGCRRGYDQRAYLLAVRATLEEVAGP